MSRCYEQLLCELESHQLQVILAPSRRSDRRETDFIRVCADKNPPWYSRMCAKYPSSRGIRRGKHDTILKRANVLALLARLSRGLPTTSKYGAELRAIAGKLAA